MFSNLVSVEISSRSFAASLQDPYLPWRSSSNCCMGERKYPPCYVPVFFILRAEQSGVLYSSPCASMHPIFKHQCRRSGAQWLIKPAEFFTRLTGSYHLKLASWSALGVESVVNCKWCSKSLETLVYLAASELRLMWTQPLHQGLWSHEQNAMRKLDWMYCTIS